MYLRRVKRKCSVRGCKNIDCLAISRTHEIGNTVIICKDCLADALKSANELKTNEKTNVKRVSTETPPLFFHPEVKEVQKTVIPENNSREEDGDKNIKKEGVKNEKQQKKSNAKQNESNSKRG